MDRLYSVNKNSDIVGMFLTHPIASFIDSIYWLTHHFSLSGELCQRMHLIAWLQVVQ